MTSHSEVQIETRAQSTPTGATGATIQSVTDSKDNSSNHVIGKSTHCIEN